VRGVYTRWFSPRQALCAVVDTLLLVASLVAATALRFWTEIIDFHTYERLVEKALVGAVLFTLTMYYNDLYDENALRRGWELLWRLGRAFLVGTLCLILFYYVVPMLRVGRGILAIYLPLAFLSILAWRLSFLWFQRSHALSDRVLILGTSQSARQLSEELVLRNPFGYKVVGFLGEHQAEVGRKLVEASVIGVVDDLETLVRQHGVDVVVVALDDRRGKLPVSELLRCRMAGVRVEEGTNFFETITGKILVSNLRPSWLVFSEGFRKPRLLRNTKRAIEFLAALVVLILALPVLLLLALLIKLDSAGPVLYRQERVGENGRSFSLMKLRTMRVDAESATGPVWASEGRDPRLTRLGRFLRKLRLDELPQLFNVLKGEMSFVGPRPERPHFVDILRKVVPYYDERHSVLPGITGWAQIKFGYGSTIEDAEEKLQYDLYYVKHMSPFMDLGIILDTIKVMVLGRGAR
jgi:sugar transferase (PEP-CTERM system associated)